MAQTQRAGSNGQRAGAALAHLLVVEEAPRHSARVAEQLMNCGYRTTCLAGAPAAEPSSTLLQHAPDLVIVIDHDGEPAPGALIRAAAAERGIPVLMVVGDPADPTALAERLTDVDDWASIASAAVELPVRVARLLRRRDPAPVSTDPTLDRSTATRAPHAGTGVRTGSGAGTRRTQSPAGIPTERSALPLGQNFLSLLIHDLRTPLNVIGLATQIISQSVPRDDPDVEENLRFLDESFQLMARMLRQLNDFQRLHEQGGSFVPVEFDPRRLVGDLVDEIQEKAGPRSSRVTLEVDESCPTVVALDPLRATQAIQYAVANAASAAKERGPVRVVVKGSADRWVTEIAVDLPPPPTVEPLTLAPTEFERICGCSAERRGMDLTIAAQVSELFGGTARLEVREGRGTSIVLEWPTRLDPTSGTGGSR